MRRLGSDNAGENDQAKSDPGVEHASPSAVDVLQLSRAAEDGAAQRNQTRKKGVSRKDAKTSKKTRASSDE